jgi:small nuclear ribonucleoprotein (snRNP)-like protein
VGTDHCTGTFKATDQEANIILSNTFEYRKPSAKEEARVLAEAANAKEGAKPARADMSQRYIGLVTVGKAHFRKIELEDKAFPGHSLPTRSKT